MEGAKLKDITWSFKKLKDYVTEPVYRAMVLKMQRAIGMVLLGAIPGFLREWENTGDNCEFCYQLLGVDVIFDDQLNAKVIECNGEPSMQTTGGGKTHYDVTKKNMIQDLVNLVYQDESAVKDAQRALLVRTRECASMETNGHPQKPIRLKKLDMSYLLDYFRELKARGEFAPVYPHPSFSSEHRRFLQHMASSSGFPKPIQKQLKSLILSHDIITEVALGGTPDVSNENEKGVSKTIPVEHSVKQSRANNKHSVQKIEDVEDVDDDVDDV